MTDDREVVADEEVGQAQLLLQVAQKVQDLRLDREIERGYRLVEDDDLGPEHERAGDGDTLPLAAREHVRIAGRVLGPEAHPAHDVGNGLAALGTRELGVDPQRLGQDGLDLLARVEGAVGILKDDLDRAPEAAALVSARRS